jgi:hypothetical protein
MAAGLEPPDEQRRLVRALAGFGVPQDDIAKHLDTDRGALEANAKVAQSLFQCWRGARWRRSPASISAARARRGTIGRPTGRPWPWPRERASCRRNAAVDRRADAGSGSAFGRPAVLRMRSAAGR